jgi:hypothetical protein
MRLILNISAGYVLVCGALSAAPPTCVTGTLTSYITLGAEGCTFDGNSFANFAYSAHASGGAAVVKADQIVITPLLLPPEEARLSFSAPWAIGQGQTQDSVISYTVVLPCGDTQPALLDLTLGAAQIGGIIASVTVDETTNVGKLNVLNRCVEVCQEKSSDSLNFKPVSVLLIRNHVSLSGGVGAVHRSTGSRRG